MMEKVCVFGQQGNLVGILSEPEQRGDAAVIFLSSGLVSRAGMGRMHVEWARALAAEGTAALRFDFSSVGDSPARTDDKSVLDIATDEPGEAITYLEDLGYTRFTLVGLCSGAVATLLAAASDKRVSAVVALNPPPLSTDPSVERAGLAKRYFQRSLFSPRAWRNLVTGRVNYGRLTGALLRNKAKAKAASDGAGPDVSQILKGLADRGTTVDFVVSSLDTAVDYVRLTLASVPASDSRTLTTVDGASHSFMRDSDKARVYEVIRAASVQH